MSKKRSYVFVKEFIEKDGYTLVSTEYKSAHDKLETICPNGHTYFVSFSKWKLGRRCLCESGRRRFNKDIIKNKCTELGFIFIGTDMDGHRRTVKYICDKGHENEVRLDHFQSGHGCAVCAGNKKVEFGVIIEEFKKEGYIVFSDDRKYYKDKINYICPNGHKNSITLSNWKAGHRCPDCSGNKKLTEHQVRNALAAEGYILNNDYSGCQKNMELECSNGHVYNVKWDNWKNKNSRCPKCGMVGISMPEIELINFLDLHHIPHITNDRELISPYELDIVIPDKKIAIEYCGLYWHSENMGKVRDYHKTKLEMCRKIGYRLITVFEDEFINKKDVVLSIISIMLGINVCKTVYARNCCVKEIDSKTAREFCEQNHLQGYTHSSIRLGAFFEDKLVAVMTFAKPSISKGYHKIDNSLELTRFCCSKYIRIVGIASKLLKYFEKNYKCDQLFSYADCRWSVGNMYEILGFNFTGFTKPNYWYIKGQDRIHRFSLRKSYSDPKNISESVLRRKQGYNRIWDCGGLHYIKYFNDVHGHGKGI